jgi:hypothetical protein
MHFFAAADPWVKTPEGTYVPMEMYVKVSAAGDDCERWLCKRNSSLVESFHAATNILGSLTGAHITDGLLATVVGHRVAQWNMQRSERLGIRAAHGMFDLELMKGIRKVQRKLAAKEGGDAGHETYVDVPLLKELPNNPYAAEEGHYFGWDPLGEARHAAAVQLTDRQRRQKGEAASAAAAVEVLLKHSKERELPSLQPTSVMHSVPSSWMAHSPTKAQPKELPPDAEYIHPSFLDALADVQKVEEEEEEVMAAAAADADKFFTGEATRLAVQAATAAAIAAATAATTSNTSPRVATRQQSWDRKAYIKHYLTQLKATAIARQQLISEGFAAQSLLLP